VTGRPGEIIVNHEKGDFIGKAIARGAENPHPTVHRDVHDRFEQMLIIYMIIWPLSRG
jgi:hypothetical protein